MTDMSAEEVFETHAAYERASEDFSLTTTRFDARVTAEGSRYRATVRVPTLEAAVEESVEQALREGWFDTLSLRLADAPKATRADVEVPEPTVERVGEEVRVEFAFTHEKPTRAAETAKALVEYVEGTYVEGIVPGFSYRPPVTDLLSRARKQGNGESESGTMPL